MTRKNGQYDSMTCSMTLTTRLLQDYSVEAHNCSGDSVGRSGCGRLTVGGATLAASGAYTCLVTAAGAGAGGGQGSSPFREDSDTKTIVVAGEVQLRGSLLFSCTE